MAIIYFLLVLSVLVLIHEAGHYFAARLFGVKADEFGYGFPPRLIGFVKDRGKWKRIGKKDRGHYASTIWSINWLPLGGFVRIKGEQADGENDADSFHTKPIWQRMIILAAGVTMNWILAAVLFSVVFMVGTQTVLDDVPAGGIIRDRTVTIMQVLADSPAASSGIRPNDIVVRVGTVDATSQDQTRNLIASAKGNPVVLELKRDDKTLNVTVTPKMLKDADHPVIGVGLADVGTVSFPPLLAIKTGALITIGYSRLIVVGFWDILRDLVTFKGVAPEVSGPVGIAVMTGEIAQRGIVPLLQFAAVLSVNLAVLNFLPIPALDGGRALFLVIEKFRRRAMGRKLEAGIHNVAFLLLIILILFVTARDLSRYGSVIIHGVKGLVGM